MDQVFPYSLAYAKKGDAVFLSHLDTLRVMERAIRRSGLPVCFTRGCNPHIRLSFYTAVPVGVETEGEWFSMKLEEEQEPSEIRSELNQALPDGFSITRVMPGKYRPLEGDPPRLALYYSGTRGDAEAALSRWMALDRIEVQGKVKGLPHVQDIRPYFLRHEIEDNFIVFYFKRLEGVRPKISELARAFRALAVEDALQLDSIRIMAADDSIPDLSPEN